MLHLVNSHCTSHACTATLHGDCCYMTAGYQGCRVGSSAALQNGCYSAAVLLYRSYDFVNNTVPRRNAVTWMLSYPADEEEMPCLWDLGVDSPYYYGMVETRGVTPFLNYRVGRRCFIGDKYAIWAMGSMIGGQSGGCLVHDKTDNCIGTAAYSCEDASQCSSACPNAWGGFNAEFPLSDLWQSCGIR